MRMGGEILTLYGKSASAFRGSYRGRNRSAEILTSPRSQMHLTQLHRITTCLDH